MSFYKIWKMFDTDINNFLNFIIIQIIECTYTEIATRSMFLSKLSSKSNAMELNKQINFYENQESITLHKSFDYATKWKPIIWNSWDNNWKSTCDYLENIRGEIARKKEAMLSYVVPYNTFWKIKINEKVHYVRMEMLTQLKARNKNNHREEKVSVNDIAGETIEIDSHKISKHLSSKFGEFSYIQTIDDRNTIVWVPIKDWKTEFGKWKTWSAVRSFKDDYTGKDIKLAWKDIEVPVLEKVDIFLSEKEKAKLVEIETQKAWNAKKQKLLNSMTSKSQLIETNEGKIIAFTAFMSIINSNESADVYWTNNYIGNKEEKVSRAKNEHWMINEMNEYIEALVDGKKHLVKKKELIEAVNSVKTESDEIVFKNRWNGETVKTRLDAIEINPLVNTSIKAEMPLKWPKTNTIQLKNEEGNQPNNRGGKRNQMEMKLAPQAQDVQAGIQVNNGNDRATRKSIKEYERNKLGLPYDRTLNVRLVAYKIQQV